MSNLSSAQEQCWEIFRQSYPEYVNEDELYVRKIRALTPPGGVVVDAGCGWHAPFAVKVADLAGEVIGVDLSLEGDPPVENVRTIHSNLEKIPLESASVDTVISRSVLEHLTSPEDVFREISRILKENGHFVFLIPNAFDYVSIISWLIPNFIHGTIVHKIMGRDPRDTYPAYYRANTPGRLRVLCREAGLDLIECQSLSQYPAYLMFSPPLFRAGIAYDKFLRSTPELGILGAWWLGVARKRVS